VKKTKAQEEEEKKRAEEEKLKKEEEDKVRVRLSVCSCFLLPFSPSSLFPWSHRSPFASLLSLLLHAC
jgi:hypothetical protein